jgi:hypothetical protein
MPTPTEIALWEYMEKNQYPLIKTLIDENPYDDLINSKSPKTARPLAMELMYRYSDTKKAGYKELQLSILKHSNLDWNVTLRNNSTIAGSVLSYVFLSKDLNLLYELKDTKGFISNKLSTAYELAIINIDNAKRNKIRADEIGIEEKMDTTGKALEAWQRIVNDVRDISLLFAINNDNDGLWGGLRDCGADVEKKFGEIGNYVSPSSLISREKTPKIMVIKNVMDMSDKYRFFISAIQEDTKEESDALTRMGDRAALGAKEILKATDEKPRKGGCSIM